MPNAVMSPSMEFQSPMLKQLHILVQLSRLVEYGVQTAVQGDVSVLKPLTVFIALSVRANYATID